MPGGKTGIASKRIVNRFFQDLKSCQVLMSDLDVSKKSGFDRTPMPQSRTKSQLSLVKSGSLIEEVVRVSNLAVLLEALSGIRSNLQQLCCSSPKIAEDKVRGLYLMDYQTSFGEKHKATLKMFSVVQHLSILN